MSRITGKKAVWQALGGHTLDNRGIQKSQEEFILSMYQTLLTEDLPRMHGHHSDFLLDFRTLSRRTTKEGLSFLTKTLPKLGKSIDSALVTGQLLIPNFHPRARKNKQGVRVRYALPDFLWVLLSQVFNPFSGKVLGRPSICAVNDLRQICYLAYKLELPYDESAIQNVVSKFIATDIELNSEFNFPTDSLEGKILAAGNVLLRDVCNGFDPYRIRPRHGPGAVATGEKPWDKFDFKVRYSQIEREFPFEEFFTLGHQYTLETLYEHDIDTEESGVARVVLVPKDSRGPRLISCEPLAYQWIQQGISRKLTRLVEKHPLTRGRVNFTDQTINRGLALRGSRRGTYDTLDLSEASDRVSVALVSLLFEGTRLLPALLATRTPRTMLPDQTEVEFRKFAPMGSALCFPIMALSIWALGAGLLHVAYGMSLKRAARSIYVYGDDIIIEHGYSPALMRVLPRFGIKFNEGKCCTTGLFRESCGCDAYIGEDVTPLKLRTLPPVKMSPDARPMLSYIEYSNTLWNKAFYSTAKLVEDHITRLYGPVPLKINFSEGDVCPSWYHRFHRNTGLVDSLGSPNLLQGMEGHRWSLHKRRWNSDLQRFEFLVKVPRSRKLHRNRPDWRELFRCLIGGEHTRACVYTQPRRVAIKRGWVCLT